MPSTTAPTPDPYPVNGDLFEASERSASHQRLDGGEVAGEPRAADLASWNADPCLAFRRWKNAQRPHQHEFRPHSLEQYESMFSAYVSWLAQRSVAVAAARPEHLEMFLQSRMGRGDKPAAPTTRRRYLRLLAETYEHLRLLELREDNPAAPLLNLREHQLLEKPAPTLLSAALAQRYIAHAEAQARAAARRWSDERSGHSGQTWLAAGAAGDATAGDLPSSAWVEVRNAALRLVFLASGITVREAQMLRLESIVEIPRPGLGADEDSGALALDVPAHGFVVARQVPVASFGRDSLLMLRQVLLDLVGPGAWLFPGRRSVFGHDEPAASAAAASEIFLVVQQSMSAIGYERDRQGPQTLRNTFIARQIADGRDVDRIMAWAGLHTPETVTRISRMVALREGEALPA